MLLLLLLLLLLLVAQCKYFYRFTMGYLMNDSMPKQQSQELRASTDGGSISQQQSLTGKVWWWWWRWWWRCRWWLYILTSIDKLNYYMISVILWSNVLISAWLWHLFQSCRKAFPNDIFKDDVLNYLGPVLIGFIAEPNELSTGWFQGLSQMFLACSPPKMLLLAGRRSILRMLIKYADYELC